MIKFRNIYNIYQGLPVFCVKYENKRESDRERILDAAKPLNLSLPTWSANLAGENRIYERARPKIRTEHLRCGVTFVTRHAVKSRLSLSLSLCNSRINFAARVSPATRYLPLALEYATSVVFITRRYRGFVDDTRARGPTAFRHVYRLLFHRAA